MHEHRPTTTRFVHFLLCLTLLATFIGYVLTSFDTQATRFALVGVAVFCVTGVVALKVGLVTTTEAKEPIAVLALTVFPLILTAPTRSTFIVVALGSVAAQALWAHIRYGPAFNDSASSRLPLLRFVTRWPLAVMLVGFALVAPLYGVVALLDSGAKDWVLDFVVVAGLLVGPPVGLAIRIRSHNEWVIAKEMLQARADELRIT